MTIPRTHAPHLYPAPLWGSTLAATLFEHWATASHRSLFARTKHEAHSSRFAPQVVLSDGEDPLPLWFGSWRASGATEMFRCPLSQIPPQTVS